MNKNICILFSLLAASALLCACGIGSAGASAAPPPQASAVESASPVEGEVWQTVEPLEGIVTNEAMTGEFLWEVLDESGTYTDENGNTVSYIYRMPRLNAVSDYAAAVNEELNALYDRYYTPALTAIEAGTTLGTTRISWSAGCYQGYTSLMVSVNDLCDQNEFYIWNFTPDGKKAGNDELFALLDMTGEQFTAKASEILSAWVSVDPSFEISDELRAQLNEVKARTLAPENMNAELPLYISDFGTLSFVCRAYSIAGAEYYDHLYTLVPENGFTVEELAVIAPDVYESGNSYRPEFCDVYPGEGTMVQIQLYDIVQDHTATSTWYSLDRMSGKGTDLLDWNVDLTVR